ncbi:hypothetical protein AB0467_34515 [Streptomyces sp. NPDC052095]|uniref:hypothetical protein n=1 Tax=unclassified Streptomyces TaxID=2593676 RepID=UPI00344DD903
MKYEVVSKREPCWPERIFEKVYEHGYRAFDYELVETFRSNQPSGPSCVRTARHGTAENGISTRDRASPPRTPLPSATHSRRSPKSCPDRVEESLTRLSAVLDDRAAPGDSVLASRTDKTESSANPVNDPTRKAGVRPSNREPAVRARTGPNGEEPHGVAEVATPGCS